MTNNKRSSAQTYQVLDPRTMGRPVHLLGKFNEQLRDDLAELLHTRLNRRYRSRFEIESICLAPQADQSKPRRWLSYVSATGRIDFALDRPLLLCILDYRYGGRDGDAGARSATQAAVAPGSQAVPETATEERLAAMLGGQLVGAVATRIEAMQPRTDDAAVPAPAMTLSELPNNLCSDDAWILRVNVIEHEQQVSGSLWFRLDEAWMTRLLRNLAPPRDRRGAQRIAGAATTQPLPARLQLTLVARLLEKQVPLGVLLDLRVGSVIPVSLGATDVLIGDTRLFTGRIVEHKGRLCLTSFEYVE